MSNEKKTKVETAHERLHERAAELPTPPVNLRSEWRANIEMMRKFDENRDYFERRITALNRRACLHEGEHCGVRARQEITGMLCVLNALGYEAVGDLNRYDGEFKLVPAEDPAAKNEGGANREPFPVQLLQRLKGRIADWDALADRFYKAKEEDRGRILCEALGIELRLKKVNTVSNVRRSSTRQRKGGKNVCGSTRSSLLPKEALRYFGLSGDEEPGEIRWTIHQRAWEDYLLRMKAAGKSGVSRSSQS